MIPCGLVVGTNASEEYTAYILRVGVSQDMKLPTVIGGLLNNDIASYSNLGYDNVWPSGGYQRFGGACCLHL